MGPGMKATKQEMEGLCQALHRLTHRWKMRASARHRLAFDMVVLCSGLRPAVMVDYAGAVSQLVQQLCQLLPLLAEECRLVSHLRVLYVEDCVHVIHVHNLWRYLEYTLGPGSLPEFVVLTKSSPRMASLPEREKILSSCRDLKVEIFKAVFSAGDQRNLDSASLPILRDDILLIDLQDRKFDVLLPTANGWLLGYPVVYTFSKQEAAEAGRRLAMTDLNLYRISLQSSCLQALRTANGDKAVDLLRFSVPKELSALEEDETWMGKFLQLSMGSCDPDLWRDLKVDVVQPPTEGVVL